MFREAVALSRQGLVRYDVITFISVQFGLSHLLEIAEQEQAMGRLSKAMGEQERNGAMAEGSLLELEDAMQLALAG